jgi:hypothetical protein
MSDAGVLSGPNEMFGVDCLQHQTSHALDDFSTPVFDKVLVIIILSLILETV